MPQSQEELLKQLQRLNQELEEGATLLIRRDLELSELNDRYAKQLLEFQILHEATLLANKTKDRQVMFQGIGELLLNRLNYDRFFIIEWQTEDFKPVVGLGFHEPNFPTILKTLQEQGTVQQLFGSESVRTFQAKSSETANQLTDAFQISSLAIARVKTSYFEAIMGVGMEHVLEAFQQEDIDFLNLLVGQLNVIVENISSFEQLQQQNLELMQVDRAKTTFLSIASHQLRTPLSVMKFALSVLANPRTGPLNSKQKELLDETIKSNRKIIGLINNLLNVTRLEQGRLNIKLSSFSLAELLHSIVGELRELMIKRKVEVMLNIPESITIVGDRLLIQEAFMNLVSNGIKYNKENGKLVIHATIKDELIIITVQDTGIGISEVEQKQLFSQFYRAQEATKVDPEGVGMGLYTTRQFIRLHHGDIAVSSVLGKGTSFTVVLPVREPRTAPGLRV